MKEFVIDMNTGESMNLEEASHKIVLLKNACREALGALQSLKDAGDAQDWDSFWPLHKAYRMLKKVCRS